MARRIVAGSGWKTVRVGFDGRAVLVVMSSSIGTVTGRFHGSSSAILCRSSRTVADGDRRAGKHGVVARRRRHRARRRRRAAPHHDHRRLLLPVVPRASRGAAPCPPMPGCVWFHAVTSGRCELVVGRRSCRAPVRRPRPRPARHRPPHRGRRPDRVPVDPRPPPRGAVRQLRRPALRRRRPAHRAGLRRTAPRAPQRPPAPGRPPARGPRPHRAPHGARRHARPAGRGGATPRGRQRGGDQPAVRHPRDPGHPPLDDERRSDRLPVADGR